MPIANSIAVFGKGIHRAVKDAMVEPGIFANMGQNAKNYTGLAQAARHEAGQLEGAAKGVLRPGVTPGVTLGDQARGVTSTGLDVVKDYMWRGASGRGLSTTQRASRIGAGWMVGNSALRGASGGSPLYNSNGEFDIAGIPIL